jgi:hypothetical protein
VNFCPLGDYLPRAVLLKITEIALILGYFFSFFSTGISVTVPPQFWETFSTVKAITFILTKNTSWASFWAIFFSNLSGHPGRSEKSGGT